MVSEARKKKFCSHSCAAKFNNPQHEWPASPCEKCGGEAPHKRRFCNSCLKEIRQLKGSEIFKRLGINADRKVCSERRMKQIRHEETEANKLRDEGFEVLSPTVVCDRIAIKAGRVFFVEFKSPGQKLRPGQQRIHDLVPEMYVVRVSS